MTSLPHSPQNWLELMDTLGDEASCEQWLAEVRWPNGFVCPSCGSQNACRLSSRPVWQCRDCRRQTSVTAGTAMHRSKVPLRIWVYALWLMSVRKVTISALQFQRETGIGSYKTCWNLLHKVRATLDESVDDKLHQGTVELDESQLGGRRGRKGRRLGEGGRWLVIAVERIVVQKKGKVYTCSGSARAEVSTNCNAETLLGFAEKSIAEGAVVQTDGWASYARLKDRGWQHWPVPVHGDKVVLDRVFPKVHLFASNFKALIIGTFHGVSGKYLHRYLAAFTYRFNRRAKKQDLFAFLARRICRVPHQSEQKLVAC